MPHDVQELVGISDRRLQGRHNVPQDEVSKIKSSVSMYVPIIPGKYSTKKSSRSMDGFNGFIKSIESSRR